LIEPSGSGAGDITFRLLSPTSNPWGSPNSDGIYIVDASDGDLRISWSPAGNPPPGFGVSQAETGPTEVRSYNSGSDQDDIVWDQRYGQYFKPNLPANATSWRVDSVEVWIRKGTTGDVDFGLHLPDGGHMPDTVVDQTTVSASALPSVFSWHTVAFSGHSALDPDEGLCLTLTSTASSPAATIQFRDTGVFETDSFLLDGDHTGWFGANINGSLRYRIHAIYTTSAGGVHIVPGSWRQVSTN
jgi:hypothetical protein